ncbi:unnamed protein product [Ascophyllum nodosum]
MFSCCALFNTEDNDKDDLEHLKALEELEMEAAAPSNDKGVGPSALSFEGTPATSSLGRSTSGTVEAQKYTTPYDFAPSSIPDGDEDPTSEATAAMEIAPQKPPAPSKGIEEGFFKSEGMEGEKMVAKGVMGEKVGASRMDKEDAGTAGSVKAGETLRALRRAEDAARAAAAEAERRRFEEEASARAARKAESEARKALWRAEEAQRLKQGGATSASAPPPPAEVKATRSPIYTNTVAKGQKVAPVASREEAERAAEAARQYVTDRLLDSHGLRLLKHGRNGRSSHRYLKSTDGCRTITWGSENYDLKTMLEARKGTDDDPDFPGFKGTSNLRSAKSASATMDSSFSLVFSSRSLDFTAPNTEECDTLIQGFNSLSAKAQQGL